MRIALLVAIIILGIAIPLFWLLGTAFSLPSLIRKSGGKTSPESLAFHANLGHTLADGGTRIDAEKAPSREG